MRQVELSAMKNKSENLAVENDLLRDQVMSAERENEKMRGLLMLALADMGGVKDSCKCERCQLKRKIKAFLEKP